MTYSKMKVSALKKLCKQNKIKGYSKLKKLQLIQLLEEHIVTEPKIEEPVITEPKVEEPKKKVTKKVVEEQFDNVTDTLIDLELLFGSDDEEEEKHNVLIMDTPMPINLRTPPVTPIAPPNSKHNSPKHKNLTIKQHQLLSCNYDLGLLSEDDEEPTMAEEQKVEEPVEEPTVAEEQKVEEPVEEPTVAEEQKVEEPTVELKTLKVKELKELCKSKGIKGYSKLKKQQLIDLLNE